MSLSLDPTGLVFPVVVDPAWSAPIAWSGTNYISTPPFLEKFSTGVPMLADNSANLYRWTGSGWEGGYQSVANGRNAAARIAGDKLLMVDGFFGDLFSPPASYAYTSVWGSNLRTTVAAPPEVRQNPGLIGLTDGRALAVGGRYFGAAKAKTAYTYTGSTNTWTATGSMVAARELPSMGLLGTSVLVMGGGDSSAEVWNGSTFASVGAPAPYHDNQPVVLDSTRALVVGGYLAPTAVHLFELGVGWKTVASVAKPHVSSGGLLTGTKRVLVAGGSAGTLDSSVEVYDPARDVWLAASPLAAPRGNTAIVSLDDGRAIAVGALASNAIMASEVFAPLPLAASCNTAYPGDCASGACEESVCCDTVGCSGTRTCTAPGKIGTCVKKNGVGCSVGTECASGQCVDGVCCDTACAGQCAACNLAGKVGTCSAAAGAPVGGRAACTVGTECSAQVCNGVDPLACHYVSSSTKCSKDACASGIATKESLCDGLGKCTDKPVGCGAYACDLKSCKTTCTLNTDCASGYVCEAGACKVAPGLGKPCTGPTGCVAPLSCVDGFCCGSATCAAGTTCGYPGKEGTCLTTNGSVCDASKGGLDCGSGFCADGVCCDAACDGQCEACDIPDATTSRKGKCIPVKGAPHGTRAACSKDPGNVCSESQCDGADRKACLGFVGTDVVCRATTCKDGTATSGGRCDGKGACPAAETTPCGGFACTTDGAACKTKCSTDDDCIKGYVCQGDACKPKTAKCSGDGLSSVAEDGTTKPCLPYRCNTSGTCKDSCATTDDCQPGFACDVASGKCQSIDTPPPDSGGGCGVTGRGADEAVGLFGLVLALGGMQRRRRRLTPS
ncbi:MAG: hypothetical protein JNL79_15125 [Myxococcales bacterium]|nr:hypothetical protein [Myxococcales bacterium]